MVRAEAVAALAAIVRLGGVSTGHYPLRILTAYSPPALLRLEAGASAEPSEDRYPRLRVQ